MPWRQNPVVILDQAILDGADRRKTAKTPPDASFRTVAAGFRNDSNHKANVSRWVRYLERCAKSRVGRYSSEIRKRKKTVWSIDKRSMYFERSGT